MQEYMSMMTWCAILVYTRRDGQFESCLRAGKEFLAPETWKMAFPRLQKALFSAKCRALRYRLVTFLPRTSMASSRIHGT